MSEGGTMSADLGRYRVLREIPGCAQSFCIAKKLGLAPKRTQVHLQWLKRRKLASYEGSRWNVTELGEIALRTSEATRPTPRDGGEADRRLGNRS